uniref:Rubrerythrin diiron-binding domain-containing protein n=1 Tax=Archaeoglobus fulgidus TaxID=2234 RepID=A0A7J2TH00_ARCFL
MNLELLKAMLEKAYRIEAGFESEANFRAFIEVMDEEQKKVLFKLMKDSEKHRITIERLSKDLGLEIEKSSPILPKFWVKG